MTRWPNLIRSLPPSRFRRIASLLCVCLLAAGASAKGPERIKVLDLTEIGMQGTGAKPASPGNTIATVHFAGDHRLLVTFPVRKLMKREAETQPGDDDRTIAAVLLDIPTGKVEARTEWRVHDGGQYLWDLGQGTFMLRIRSRLVTINPTANLNKPEPFEEHKLLSFEDRIVGIIVAAETDLLTVETNSRAVADPTKTAIKTSDADVTISFFRLTHPAGTAIAAHAGSVRSSIPLALPITADGYLDIKEESKGRWLFDYLPHEGKKLELSPYDTSCFPRALFVSRSEFISFGCRGSVDKVELGGFNMKAEELWEQTIPEAFAFPTFAFAPNAGRFAIGRALSSVSMSMLGPDQDPFGEMLTAQDVQVYQASTGKPVFHTVITPVQRIGQNFALSADGLQFAVVRDGFVEVYRLPDLSGRDKQDVKANREFALERSTGAIRLPTRTKVAAAAVEAASSPTPAIAAPAPSVPATATQPPKPIENPVYVGDVPAEEHRKAPSLYQPGESAPK